jgi:hypothetical protein
MSMVQSSGKDAKTAATGRPQIAKAVVALREGPA